MRSSEPPTEPVAAAPPAVPAGPCAPGARPSPDDLASHVSLAADLAGIALWRHDVASQRVHYNGEAWRVLDVEPRPEGLHISEMRRLVHREDLPRVLASIRTALETGRPTDVEARYRRRDGRWSHLLTRRSVQRDADGRPVAFLGVALDITERVDEQRRADEMARRFELVTHTAGIGWWSFVPPADLAFWSDTMRRLFDLPERAPVPTLKEWIERYVHPDDREAMRAGFRAWRHGHGDSLNQSFRILRSGAVRHVVAHTRFESREPAAMLFGVVIDVTERASAERELRGARERAALAADSAGIGTWEMDVATGHTLWDAQMWRLRGHEPQPGAMPFEQRVACLHPDDREATVAVMRQALEQRAPLEHEYRVVWPDGRVRWLASRSVVRHDEVTGAPHRIGVNWDITDARVAQEAQRERELALRESRAKSEFLARMSHELRTPLNAVMGFSQLLLADETGTDPAAARRRGRLEHVRSAGQHLLSLINDVLDLARLQGGEMRVAREPVVLAAVVEQTLPLVQALEQARGIRVEHAVGGQRVMADPTRLRQVLLNLVTNALKYNRDGGQVRVEAVADGDEAVLLRVADTGDGLTPAQLQHLFEPFNRLGADRGPVEGTGIGLAISKGLVERMGGTIAVSSTVGLGTVFEVRLPAAGGAGAPTTAEDGAPPAPAFAASGRRHRVLYIEDNPVNALIVSELVARRPDIELAVAPDGGSGVARAGSFAPELILLDMQLPDIDGFEVMRRLRSAAATAPIPVIALSANAMPDDIQRALAAGLADYWTKPLDLPAFMAHLERLFGTAPA